MAHCPCGSELSYSECCEPIIRGERPAQSAEALLRSRYTAYTQAEIDHISATTHPERRSDFDPESSRQWAQESQWHQLEILKAAAGGPEDETGQVEFVAHFTQNGVHNRHHELAEFRKQDGAWYFWDGNPVKMKPFVRQGVKLGRNDPCSCGSGKKYKKCCGTA
jgi:SEC-C motif domain protein